MASRRKQVHDQIILGQLHEYKTKLEELEKWAEDRLVKFGGDHSAYDVLRIIKRKSK